MTTTATIQRPYCLGERYGFCFNDQSDVIRAMDPRHIYMLHDVLAAWPFVNALELGSWKGASATAFIEAINGGAAMHATFCDTQLMPHLMGVMRHCIDPNRVHVAWMESWAMLAEPVEFDFIFVDASHDLDSVKKELVPLMERLPLCVMAHDTNSTATGRVNHEGAELLKRTLCDHPDYYCVEDAQQRSGEATERGLFLATRDPHLFEIACDIFAREVA